MAGCVGRAAPASPQSREARRGRAPARVPRAAVCWRRSSPAAAAGPQPVLLPANTPPPATCALQLCTRNLRSDATQHAAPPRLAANSEKHCCKDWTVRWRRFLLLSASFLRSAEVHTETDTHGLPPGDGRAGTLKTQLILYENLRRRPAHLKPHRV